MARFDDVSLMKPVRLFSPITIGATTPLTSTTVDTLGFDAVTLIFNLGAINDMVSSIVINDSPDDSVWTAVADTFLIGNLEANIASVATDDNELASIGYRGDKRYLQVVLTPSTASGTNLYCAIALLGQPQKAAVAVSQFTA